MIPHALNSLSHYLLLPDIPIFRLEITEITEIYPVFGFVNSVFSVVKVFSPLK